MIRYTAKKPKLHMTMYTYSLFNPCDAGPVYRRKKKCQIVLLVAWYVTSEKKLSHVLTTMVGKRIKFPIDWYH